MWPLAGVPPTIPPKPLDAAVPPTWDARIERVAFVLLHFTEGELAYLYKMLDDGRNYRNMSRYSLDAVIEKERKACSKG